MRCGSRLSALASLVVLWGGAAGAAPPSLHLPVACALPEACYVQNYVDADPGPGASDQTCGPLSYDGHDAVDIAVPTLAAMRRGVAVLAAAPGRVKALRDGMADRIMTDPDDPALKGREAGNGVVLDHGDGWETQYSHLREGSVAVEVGQEVAAGERLGEIGLSGRSVFPHLELQVRHRGQAVDPYTGLPPGAGCGRAAQGLWSPAAARSLAYVGAGFLDAGFLGQVPKAATAWRGGYRGAGVAAEDPVLVFWIGGWGLRAGDREELRLWGPDGTLLAEHQGVAEADKARFFRFLGKRRGTEPWPAGRYRAEFLLHRPGGGRIIAVTREHALSPR